MPLVDKVEVFLPVYKWTAEADGSLIHTLSDDTSRTSVTNVAFFSNVMTTLVAINSAQILQIKLLSLDPVKWRINRNRRAAACVVCRASQIPGDRASSRIQRRKHGIKSVLLLTTFSSSFSDSLWKKTGQGGTTGTSFLPPAVQYVSYALPFRSLKWDRAPVIKFRDYQMMHTHKANLLKLHRLSNF